MARRAGRTTWSSSSQSLRQLSWAPCSEGTQLLLFLPPLPAGHFRARRSHVAFAPVGNCSDCTGSAHLNKWRSMLLRIGHWRKLDLQRKPFKTHVATKSSDRTTVTTEPEIGLTAREWEFPTRRSGRDDPTLGSGVGARRRSGVRLRDSEPGPEYLAPPLICSTRLCGQRFSGHLIR
jgi:hypothetical protein